MLNSSAQIKKLAVCTVFLCAAYLCFSQSAGAREEQSGAQSNEASAQSQSNSQQNPFLLPGSQTQDVPALPAARSSVFLFIRMIAVLALVTLCIYIVMRFFKRGMTGAFANDPYLKKTASLTLSPGKSVHVVTLDDSAFIIGVTDSAVNLIGKVENKELVDAMNLRAEETAASPMPRDFSRLLDIFGGARNKCPRGKGAADKPVAEIFDETASIIRGQRSRFSTPREQNGDDKE